MYTNNKKARRLLSTDFFDRCVGLERAAPVRRLVQKVSGGHYNPFDKLERKKLKDEGNIKPATIEDIQRFLKCLDKDNYMQLRDDNIILLILDTGIRSYELIAITNSDYNPVSKSIYIRQEVAKTNVEKSHIKNEIQIYIFKRGA